MRYAKDSPNLLCVPCSRLHLYKQVVSGLVWAWSRGKVRPFIPVCSLEVVLGSCQIILSMYVNAWREGASKAEPGSCQGWLVTRRGDGHGLAGRRLPMSIREHVCAADCLPWGCSQAIRRGPRYPALLWCPCLSRRWGQMDTEVPSHLSHSETCNHQYCWVCVSTGKVKKAALMLCEFKRFGGLYDPLSFPAHCLVVLSGCFPLGTVLQLPFLGLCLWICKQQSPVEAGKVPEIKHPILLMKYSLWESLQVMLWLHISCNYFLVVLHFLSQVNFKGSR